jgi:hypothetical protein
MVRVDRIGVDRFARMLRFELVLRGTGCSSL